MKNILNVIHFMLAMGAAFYLGFGFILGCIKKRLAMGK